MAARWWVIFVALAVAWVPIATCGGTTAGQAEGCGPSCCCESACPCVVTGDPVPVPSAAVAPATPDLLPVPPAPGREAWRRPAIHHPVSGAVSAVPPFPGRAFLCVWTT